MDADGYLYVEGRLDDVIVRGGENISPGEIEAVLVEHPAVADAGVVGVRSEEWGEDVAAVVVAAGPEAPDPDELRAWVRSRLRSSRTPRMILVAASLPYNEMGKLRRAELRACFPDSLTP
jgi:acyl-coenzyme A synthetase/AMP-(fatty) acid ligase